MTSIRDAALFPLITIIGGDGPDRLVQVGSRVKLSGTTDMRKLLLKTDDYHRVFVNQSFFRQSRRPDLTPYRCILNMVAEPEQNSRTLENLRKLLRNVPGKVVNRPEAVLRTTRDRVSQLLQGIPGLIAPRVARLPAGKPRQARLAIEKLGMSPPIILRPIGTHGGRIVGLFDSLDALLEAVDFSVDHLAVEFVDFRSEDGLYRKHRVFFFGDQMILRHRLISDDWNVHAKDRARFMAGRPDLVAEERALFDAKPDPFPPQIMQVLKAVRERMPLDFFGMDFGIMPDGTVVLFEANAAMSFFPLSTDPQFDYLRRNVEPASRAFRELLELPQFQARAAPFSWRMEKAS